MERQLVDIFGGNRKIVGGALFIDRRTIITCAHVINDALGRNEGVHSRPEGVVIMANFSIGERTTDNFPCIIREWFFDGNNPRISDFAILEIVHTSDISILEAREEADILRTSNDYFNNVGRVYGSPIGLAGDSSPALLLSRDSQGLIIIKTDIPIGTGFSGYPVYSDTLKGFVGIVWGGMRDRRTTAYVIPFEEIIKRCPSIAPYRKVFNKTGLVLPPNIIFRQYYLDKIGNALDSTSLCIVVGPSGYGKSVLCDIYLRTIQIEKKKFEHSMSPIDLNGFAGVLYIDNYTEQSVVAYALRGTHDYKVLLNCKSLNNALDILRDKGLFLLKDEIIVNVQGFSNIEAEELLLNHGCQDDLAREEIASYVRFTEGSPIALQGLIQLVKEGGLGPDFFQQGVLDNEKVFQKILYKYLEIKTELTREALALLSAVPFIGMNLTTVAMLLNKPVEEVSKALKGVIEMGYILEYQKNRRFFKESILVCHELVKKAFENYFSSSKENRLLYRKYNINYFNYISRIRDEGVDLISRIDAFVCGIRGTFKVLWNNERYTEDDLKILHNESIPWPNYSVTLQDKVKNYKQEEKYFDGELERITSVAPKLFPIHLNEAQCNVIIEYFKNSIASADCSELIGLSHAFSSLPQNRLLSDCIWQGITNYDTWAVGTCIRAAVHHSKEGDTVTIPTRIQQLQTWLQYKSKLREATDLDITAAIGGLIYLDCTDWVYEELLTPQYFQRMGITALSDLPLIVHFANTNQTDRLVQFYRQAGSRICPSKTKCMVLDYVKHRTGLSLDRNNCNHPNIIKDVDFSLSVARVLFSNEYWNYAFELGCRHPSYF